MNSLSKQLLEATQEPAEGDEEESEQSPGGDQSETPGGDQPPQQDSPRGGRDRVILALGQDVEVRTTEGQLVVAGTIQELNQETGSVRVVDRSSGTDNQVDVDPELYEIWVNPHDALGTGGKGTPEATPSVNPRKRGAYDGGRVGI